MKPVDAEDDERIARHRDERDGWGFITVEQATQIEDVLDKCDVSGSFLLDSLTALLAEEMFSRDGRIDEHAVDRVGLGLSRVLNAVDNIVVVSDYIYSDAELFDPLTELYRKSLAQLDCVAAKLCDVVIEVAYAGVAVHKGKDIFNMLDSCFAVPNSVGVVDEICV